MTEVRAKKKRPVISAKWVIIPCVLLTLLLHGLMIYFTILVNAGGEAVSRVSQSSFTCARVENSIYQNTELLSRSAIEFIGSCNELSLNRYLIKQQELESEFSIFDRMLEERGLPEARSFLETTIRAVESQMETELYAMRLCAEAEDCRSIAFPPLSQTALSAEDRALSPREQREKADALLREREYLAARNSVQLGLRGTYYMLEKDSELFVERQELALSRYRTVQWAASVVLMCLLLLASCLLFFKVLIPLEQGVKKVQNGEVVQEDVGFAEVRSLAGAYNELLRIRTELEGRLRMQSRTDSLTGLSNRAAFQDYVEGLKKKPAETSVTVFSMDVNGLKAVNDGKGHTFGDILLRDAAACILTVLGTGTGKNCFRFGGDEFAAVRLDLPEGEAERLIGLFEQEQEKRGVSISAGWARGTNDGPESFKALMDLADQRMYEMKAIHHAKYGGRGA